MAGREWNNDGIDFSGLMRPTWDPSAPDPDVVELCGEVLAELLARPCERFYSSELVALTVALRGDYEHNQILLDWLFDLRRLTAESLEGTMYSYAVEGRPKRADWRMPRREPCVPYFLPRIR
jgi:hypothetical protein